jgi:hypothetical protein
VPPYVTQLWGKKKTFLERSTIPKSVDIQRKNLFYHFRYCKPTQHTQVEHTDIMKQLCAPGSWVKQMFFKLCATHARSEFLQ